MASIFLWMFAAGGLTLVGLVWLGAAYHGDGASNGGASLGSGAHGSTSHGDTVQGGEGLLADVAALLSVRGLLAAMTGAGAVGLMLTRLVPAPPAAAIAGAAAGAIVAASLWQRVMRTMVAFDRNHGVARDVVLGREGVLTVGIGGPGSPGVVQLTLGGLSQEYTAVPEDGRSYAEGARVVVVRLLSDTSVAVEASPYPAPSLSP
jgi:membrane protein implicated in regulation of membrane protease activity